ELARQLSARGARLIVTARRAEALAGVAESCRRHSPDCKILPADMARADALQDVTEQAMGVYGRIDVFIHSAGFSQRSTAKNTSIDTIRKIMEVNFFAAVAITKYLLPHFAERRSGHIVAISSMAGLMGFPLRTGYAASKHAVKGFFETMQTEDDIPGLN